MGEARRRAALGLGPKQRPEMRGIQPSTKINRETVLLPLGGQTKRKIARGVEIIAQGANRAKRRGNQFPRYISAEPGQGRKSRVGQPSTPWAQRTPLAGTTTRTASSIRREQRRAAYALDGTTGMCA